MVVGVEPEERQVRVHDPDVDAVEVQVLEDHLGVALGHPPAGLAVPRDGPPLEAGRVQPTEDPGPALDERLDLEVVLPDAAVAQVRGQAGDEQVGGLEDVPVGGDDKGLVGHVNCPFRPFRRETVERRGRSRNCAKVLPAG